MFHGSMVALVTPMVNDTVDVEALKDLVNFHIDSGTHGLVAAGTTGESGTLSHAEKLLVIETVIKAAKERVPVIAGTAVNATKDCVKLTREAMELGADAALIMTPAYIKPTQEGLYRHFATIAKNCALPIILYNVPGRTAVDMLPATVARLNAIANIVGIKEATGSLERLRQIIELTDGGVDVYSGDDPTACEWMLNGAKGVISVTANVAPKLMAQLCEACKVQNTDMAKEINDKLKHLHEHLFLESNPIPTKWALAEMGKIAQDIRMPLTTLTAKNQEILRATLKSLELL